MGFGLLAALCSTAKTIELRNLTEATDITFFLSRLNFATMIEAWIVLIVGCVPSLRPLMKAVAQKFLGTPATKQTLRIYTYQHEGHTIVLKDTNSGRGEHGEPGDKVSVYFHPDLCVKEPRELRKAGIKSSNDNELCLRESGLIMKTTDIFIQYDSTLSEKAREGLSVPERAV